MLFLKDKSSNPDSRTGSSGTMKEDAMLKSARIIAAISIVLGSFSPAFAASARTDSSGLAVWIFLGFCGLIVMAQFLPALMLMFGLVKGVASTEPEGEKAC